MTTQTDEHWYLCQFNTLWGIKRWVRSGRGRGSSGGGETERIGTDLAHADGLAEVELENGDLVAGALLTQQTPTVPTTDNKQTNKQINDWK